MRQRSIPPVGPLAVTFVSLTLAAYFIFSAIQGDYGILRRAAYQAEADELQRKLSTGATFNFPTGKQNSAACQITI
jgi:cell division protein FtsB